MPKVVSRVVPTALSSSGAQKLGQPVPLSNLVSDENRPWSQPAQAKTPARCSLRSGLVNGRSVALWRNTAYCSGFNSLRHSSSVWVTANGSPVEEADQDEPSHAASPTALVASKTRLVIIDRASSTHVGPNAHYEMRSGTLYLN